MRIGFACKFIPDINDKATYRNHNFTATTIKWLNENENKQHDRLFEILKHNVYALSCVLKIVSTWPEMLRMMRIGSDFFPAYTHYNFKWFWQQIAVQDFLSSTLPNIGKFARQHNIRLSMHPGQYTVLNSINDDTIINSIEEIEYHTDIAKFLGYTRWHQDGFAINVHVGSRAGGITLFREHAQLLSETARNLLTIENDELSFGIDAILTLADEFAIVLDIHHHLIHSGGKYISPSDNRIKKIINSWRGIRPKIHYSISREEHIGTMENKPDIGTLLESGVSKTKLRAHSDWYRNKECNKWALSFLPDFDIMCESKMKNLASAELYQFWKSLS